MHKDPFVFSQLTRFLDRNHFNYLVRKYDGDKHVKRYTCWNQSLTMMFGQHSAREFFPYKFMPKTEATADPETVKMFMSRH